MLGREPRGTFTGSDNQFAGVHSAEVSGCHRFRDGKRFEVGFGSVLVHANNSNQFVIWTGLEKRNTCLDRSILDGLVEGKGLPFLSSGLKGFQELFFDEDIFCTEHI